MRLETKSYAPLVRRPTSPIGGEGLVQSGVNPDAETHYKQLTVNALSGSPGRGGMGAGNRGGPRQDSASQDPFIHRLWREANPFLAAGIDMRREDAQSEFPSFNSIDPKAKTAGEDEVHDAIVSVFKNPWPEGDIHDFGDLVGQFVEDLLIVGRAVIQPQREKGTGPPERLIPLDGARVSANPKWTPQSADSVPRWIYANPYTNQEEMFGAGELIVAQPTLTSYRATGLSPMTYIHRFLLAELDTFRALHYSQRNLQPPGVLKVPTQNPKTIRKLEQMWREKVQGKGAVAIVNIPAESEWMPMGATNLQALQTMEFYDVLIRAIAAALRTTTTRLSWTQTTLERTADAQDDIWDEGMVNLMRFLVRVWNRIIKLWGDDAANLTAYYPQIPQAEESDSVDVTKAKAGAAYNPYPLSAVWQAAGLEVPDGIPADDPWWHDPYWHIGQNVYVPLSVARTLPQFQEHDPEADKAAALAQATAPAALPAGEPQSGEPGAAEGGRATPPEPTAPSNGNGSVTPATAKQVVGAGKPTTKAANPNQATETTPIDPESRAARDDLAAEFTRIFTETLRRTSTETHRPLKETNRG